MIKAVIFDMDGLLIDSEPFWREAHIQIVKKYGGHVTEDEVRHKAGIPTQTIAQFWIDKYSLNTNVDTLATEITEYGISKMKDHVKAFPGALELVKKLHTLAVPMAIATSAREDVIAVVMNRLHFAKYIPIIHSATKEKRGKPFPDVFLSTAKMLGANPNECLVFEDSVNGVLAAEAAGMACVAVPESPYDSNRFKDANKIIDLLADFDFNDLKKF